MSALLLTFLVLSVGAVTYRLFDRLVRSVRIFVVCLLMVSLTAFILQSREIFSQFIKSGGVFSFATFSDKGAPNVPSPTEASRIPNSAERPHRQTPNNSRKLPSGRSSRPACRQLSGSSMPLRTHKTNSAGAMPITASAKACLIFIRTKV